MSHYSPFRSGVVSDTVRQHGRFTKGLLVKSFLTVPTFRVAITLRLCQRLAALGAIGAIPLLICRILHMLSARSACMDISWRTRVGLGLKFTHGYGTVISPGANIGTNCTFFHGATLGRGDIFDANGERTIGYPTIEDEVWIGPHAVVVGSVTIGKGSRIMAGAYVTSDVPPHSLVVGNPAQIVRSNVRPDCFNPFCG